MDDTLSNGNSNLFSGSSDLPDFPQDEHSEKVSGDEKSVFSSFAEDKTFEDHVGLSIGLSRKPISDSSATEGPRLFSSFLKPDDAESDASNSSDLLQSNDSHDDKMQFFPLDHPIVEESRSVISDQPATEHPVESTIDASPVTEVVNPVVSQDHKAASDDAYLDQLSDQAFPLFLRFKASDNISSVADALREKSHRSFPSSDQTPVQPGILSSSDAVNQSDMSEELSHPTNFESPDSFSELNDIKINNDLTDNDPLKDMPLDDLSDFDLDHELLSRPIFKPAPATESLKDSDTLNIPDVFQQHSEQEIVASPISESPRPIDQTPVLLPDDPNYYEDTEIPVFVPLKQFHNQPAEASADSSSPKAEPAVPESMPVFSPPKTERPGSKDVRSDKLNERPGSKDHPHNDKTATRPGAQEANRPATPKSLKPPVSSRSAQVPVKPSTETISAKERVISNRYTAAQQMGTIAPLPLRETKARRKSGARAPILIALLSVALIIGLVAMWSFFDLGSVLFGNRLVVSSPVTSSITTVTTGSPTSDNPVAGEETTLSATEATTQEAVETTTKDIEETTIATTVATTASTTKAATESTTAATTQATTEATSSNSDKVPAWFDAKITNGTSDQDTAIFDLNFTNRGSSAVSLKDGLRQITLTFLTDIEISSVSSDSFTFTAKEGTTNVFIGVPTSADTIEKGEIKTTTIYGKSSGASVGKYKVKYLLEYYE